MKPGEHTPGPWVIDEPYRPWICTVGNNADDPAIFGAQSPTGEPFVWGDKLADARLIAAAPTLLAALEYARNLIGPDEILDAAIAEARQGAPAND